MKFSPVHIASAFAVCLALGACAKETPARPTGKALSCEASQTGSVTAQGAWLREQQDASAMTAGYFSLCNGTMAPVTLTGLSTPAAGVVELHETSRDEAGIVSMAPTGAITLQPGERVVFEPGGKHAMLMALPAPVASGAKSVFTLEFADGSSISVEAVAKSAVEAASEPTGEHEGH